MQPRAAAGRSRKTKTVQAGEALMVSLRLFCPGGFLPKVQIRPPRVPQVVQWKGGALTSKPPLSGWCDARVIILLDQQHRWGDDSAPHPYKHK